MANINIGGNQIVGNNNSIVQETNINNAEQGKLGTMDNSLREKILGLISQGQLKDALLEIVKWDNSDHTRDQIVQLMGRLSKLEIDKITGVITSDEENLETNKIRHAAVLMVSRS